MPAAVNSPRKIYRDIKSLDFICECCTQSFGSKVLAQSHVCNNAVQPNAFPCTKAKRVCRENDGYKCENCNTSLGSSLDALKHVLYTGAIVRIVHVGLSRTYFVCESCARWFESEDECESHIKLNSCVLDQQVQLNNAQQPNQRLNKNRCARLKAIDLNTKGLGYICRACGLIFPSKYDAMVHTSCFPEISKLYVDFNRLDTYVCGCCYKSFESWKNAVSHLVCFPYPKITMITLLNYDRYDCNTCTRSFGGPNQAKLHIVSNMPPKINVPKAKYNKIAAMFFGIILKAFG